ncbi:PDR/VanB family oxidoreductase [Pseudomonas soli]|jgi:ferredoxin-NADP reductase|uniref:PDR/VanB family oxidoreductase n=1 Tax=Pseudomonas TaxID=286 RepID=UPI000CDBB638|nr:MULTISPECIES: PDR/VanB family oxidoreductase [Pseudomonas]AUY32489.1 ferredoxin--NADP(+) reductase [Pseudomonas sp. PONIH3]MDT3712633.1 PDR/VanB family oxidoreductase [Pseudomonas soli]MDT3729970.1 PDR/VanB family oxidoreductase [Pseudomonas soli]
MAKQYEMFKVRVTGVEQATPQIKRFTLARADGGPLPAFSGGSHVIVQMQSPCGSQFSNAYSLMSDPRQLHSYQIGVRLEEQSKGGSAFMHNQVAVGSELTISTPNNLFALDADAGRHVLIAGGIGITPFLAQLHELEDGATPYELHYAFRAPEHGAFQGDLEQGPHAGNTRFYIDSLDRKLDLTALCAGLADDAHLYVCGPKPLIDAVIATAAAAGIAESRVHWEQFAAAAPATGAAFTVVLARSGTELQVEEGMTILQAIEKSKTAKVECLCREGVCGTCETAILEGEAEHFDQYLSDEEKAAQQSMMLCVSRARSARLVLDL